MSVEWNKHAILVIAGISALLLYAFYNYLPSIGTKYHTHSHQSWKSKSHVHIPDSVNRLQEQVKIETKTVAVQFKKLKVNVFYREALPVGQDCGIPVVLLHGAGDSSEKWANLGTMHLAAAMGHRVVAFDLPGMGNTIDEISYEDESHFLAPFLDSVKIDRPVIIAASYGGNYAIPYIMEPNPTLCRQKARGFVPIATTSTGKYKPAQYHRCDVPSMLVFGVNDTRLGLTMVGDLRNLLNNEIEPVKKAGHAVMFERPKEWHKLLYNFLNTLQQT